MSMTEESRIYHEVYERCPRDVRHAVDDSFAALQTSLRSSGVRHLSNSDPAEEMVAAITKYIHSSGMERRELEAKNGDTVQP
jgi:hypothetical protein